ncbi:MAG: hypothetical protein AAFR81_24535 [Chloroflexota bacterium]
MQSVSEQRQTFVEQWHKREKMLERIAAVILLFAAGAIVALDQPGDQWTLLAITGSVAGSLTLFMKARTPRAERTALHFLKADKQMQRSMYAGGGAILLITQMGTRPLTLIVGGMLLCVAGWFNWRAKQIQAFDALGKTATGEPDDMIEGDYDTESEI